MDSPGVLRPKYKGRKEGGTEASMTDFPYVSREPGWDIAGVHGQAGMAWQHDGKQHCGEHPGWLA
eukprot:12927855-Prorocentrum_lima.AAC.1